MSRFHEYDGDGDDAANGGDLWTARARNALEGKRGRKALADLRDAMLALPEKRLIGRALCTVGADARVAAVAMAHDENEYLARLHEQDAADLRALVAEQGEGVCAIGAYVWWQKVKGGMTPEEAFAALPTIADVEGGGDYETADIGKEHGLTYTLAWELASRNDDQWEHQSPEQRYVSFLTWIDAQLAKPPLKAAPRREKRRRSTKPVRLARVAVDQVGLGL